SLFVSSPIEKIIGLKRRANPELGIALINTVRERFAAGRNIPLEIWCLIGYCMNKNVFTVLKEMLIDNPTLEGNALLACEHSDLHEAKQFLNERKDKLNGMEKERESLRHFDKQIKN